MSLGISKKKVVGMKLKFPLGMHISLRYAYFPCMHISQNLEMFIFENKFPMPFISKKVGVFLCNFQCCIPNIIDSEVYKFTSLR